MAETPSIIVEAEQILEATGSSAVSTARQSAARSRTPAAAASVPGSAAGAGRRSGLEVPPCGL